MLSDAHLEKIFNQVERDYPRESCGLIVRSISNPEQCRVIPVRNAQNDLHRQSPAEYPRTAKTAYWMDPRALLAIHKELRQNGEEIAVIYHSHPDGEASFSQEDNRLALAENGEPVYAEAAYLVISVIAGRAAGWKLFRWNAHEREFRA